MPGGRGRCHDQIQVPDAYKKVVPQTAEKKHFFGGRNKIQSTSLISEYLETVLHPRGSAVFNNIWI